MRSLTICSACYLLHAAFLLGLIFDTEDDEKYVYSSGMLVHLQRTTRRYIPEDRTLSGLTSGLDDDEDGLFPMESDN
jgi:hypothetical protein